MSRVLVADDEAHIREVVRYALARDGHQVDTADDGEQALARLARGGVDLVVLDVLMPELDGLAVCRRVRATARVPIIFLSSRTEEADRVLGLELGGDDYVTKPFSPRELAARVRAVLRRAGADEPPLAPPPPPLVRGRVAIDRARAECTIDAGAVVPLTVTELRLLTALLEHPGRVLSRAQLIACAYDGDHHVTTRTVDTHVRNIRAKLASHGVDAITTVHGLGYRGG
ncbi:MAG: response regulator transcription factor [Myxococcales bacterium]|jgi:two-component system OmpR family response regulator|nr:response regulator transcription factor [Myxococcales bacterium]MBK7196046.1 response regulator transcription factor [Myxococcales bacterium]MBP6846210.1 response regulator transcription factor [Kofleriaceae bacterium]